MELVVWPYVAHSEDGRSEEYEWNTQVMLGPTFEQRVSMRDMPLFTCSAVYELQPAQLGQARLLIEACYRYDNRLLLPLWSERVFTTSTVNGVMTNLFGDFRFTRFDVDGKGIVWLSPDEYYEIEVTNVAPDRIFFHDVSFPNLSNRRPIVMPLLEGRVDGDFTVTMQESKKHRASFDFRSKEERNYKYKLRVCLCLDGSGSMNGSKWENQRDSVNRLLDYLATFCESPLVDLSLRVVFPSQTGADPTMDWEYLNDVDSIEETKIWITAIDANAGVFSYPDACINIVDWFSDSEPSTNIAMVLTDSEDATEAIISGCETLLADILDVETSPYSVVDGTAVSVYTVGIDSNATELAYMSRLSNVGDAIRLTGTSLEQFDQVLQDIIFGLDTPLASYRSLFSVFEGMPVLSRKYISEEGVNDVITRARTAFVTPSGIDWVVNERVVNENEYMLNFEFLSDDERQAMLIWLHSQKGQKKAFWLPSQNRDLIMDSPQTDESHMHIRKAGIDTAYRLMENRYQIETSRGEFFYTGISNVALVPTEPGIIRVTLSNPTPRILKPKDIVGIHLMRKMRFSTDVALMNHENLWKTRLSMSAVRVLEPFVPPVIPEPEPVWPPEIP